MKRNRAGIINIGNEILLGKTINTNLAKIGQALAGIGLFISESVTIADDEEQILHTLKDYSERFELIICTGGLGPTDDDISKQAFARFYGKEMVYYPEIWQNILTMFARRNMNIPEINKNQAYVPKDFIYFNNQVGTAPGLYYKAESHVFFALPGVPLEMSWLLDHYVVPEIRSLTAHNALYVKTLNTFGISESKTAELMKDLVIPDGVKIAWLPQTGRVDIRIYGENEAQCESLILQIREILKDTIWGENENSVMEKLHRHLSSNPKTICVAESCTGGMLGKMLTDYSGSSQYFKGGVLAYHNEVKQKVLNVSAVTLDDKGAVSEETACEMVEGLKGIFDCDYYIAVTGIAGPEGGTEEKPVGLVYMSLADHQNTEVYKMNFVGTRDSIRFKTCEYILFQLMKRLGIS